MPSMNDQHFKMMYLNLSWAVLFLGIATVKQILLLSYYRKSNTLDFLHADSKF